MRFSRMPISVWSTVLIFCLSALPLAAQSTGKPADLKGFVYLAEKRIVEGKKEQITLTPLEDAEVWLRNSVDNKEYKSPKTPEDGSYKFESLPAGSYLPGIIVNDKKYNVEGTIRLDPGEDVIISLYIEKKGPVLLPIKHGFFNSPWGIAALAAGTGTAGLIIYNVIKKDEPETSPTRR